MAPLHAVLIHGAWQGSWVWDTMLAPLRALGWNPVAVDLPGNGTDTTDPAEVTLDLYAAHVAGVLESLPGPAVVVGHSGGGIIASQAAERVPERVAALVYLAGMMLPDGVSYGDVVRDVTATLPSAPGIAPHLLWSADGLTSTVPVEAAIRFFYQDCDPAAARAAASRLTAQPEQARDVRPALTPARYGRLPRRYIRTLRDASVQLPIQDRMLALSPGALVWDLDSGHAPQLGQPEPLARIMDAAARA